MKWLSRLINQQKLDLQNIGVNDNDFRVEYVKSSLEKNFIICNGMEYPINWGKVVRFDLGGPACDPKNTKIRKRRNPKLFVVHWDGCFSSVQMLQVLKQRGLSVHFAIDNDGTILQLMDTKDIAWHAKGVNNRSIGVEICNPVSERYQRNILDSGLPERPIISGDQKHGKNLEDYLGFYPVQIEALKTLTESLHLSLDIPLQVPLDNSQKLKQTVDKKVAGRVFNGVVGHYHLNPGKIDPGYLDLKTIVEDVKASLSRREDEK